MLRYTGGPAEVERGHYLDVNTCEVDATESDAPAAAPRSLAARRLIAAATVLGIVACAGLLGTAVFGTVARHRVGHSVLTARAQAAVQLDSQEEPMRNPFVEPPPEEEPKRALQKPLGSESIAQAVTSAPPTTAPPTTAPPTTAAPAEVITASALSPTEDMHDGNVCEADEELHDGLCYRKCSLLTQGEAKIRSSAWTCCKEHPCGLTNERASAGRKILCSGFDIGGKGGCPHKPGACLTDEELYLGVCYKKCSILTSNEFPHRLAAATCCKPGGFGCLDVFHHDKTSPSFAVGGGSGDNDPATPDGAHAPSESLTEVAHEVTTPALVIAEVPKATTLAPPNPMAHQGSGSGCRPDEELYGGLCYKKCSLLTYGAETIRTSSWTCCAGRPCTPFNTKGKVSFKILCTGYDVGADGNCPRAPGLCKDDEELYSSVCYKKCSLLTQDAFPHRITAATCCKGAGLDCLNPRNVKTSPAFAVGSTGVEEEVAKGKSHSQLFLQ